MEVDEHSITCPHCGELLHRPTPRPWWVGVDGHNILARSCVEADRAVMIATVYHEISGGPIPSEADCREAHANARVIAAAPELLEGLKAMVAAYCGEGDGREADWCLRQCDRARAVIAKAEGRIA